MTAAPCQDILAPACTLTHATFGDVVAHLKGAKNNVSINNQQKYSCLTPEQRGALAAVDGNSKCADCGGENPVWASLNLTSVFCIACSGIHRNMGVHISRVRSLELDDWRPDHLQIMMAFGNGAANAVWEANVPKGRKPPVGADRDAMDAFIREKYETRAFVTKTGWYVIQVSRNVLLERCATIGRTTGLQSL